MRTSHAIIIAIGLVISTAIASAAAVLAGGRYMMFSMPDSHIVWKLDRLTGQSYGCEESEFGPFCIPAPNNIKHGP